MYKKTFFWIASKLKKSKIISIKILFANLELILRGSSVRVSHDSTKGLYYVPDEGARHYFGNLERGVRLYSKGLIYRSKQLFDSYSLSEIEFRENDVVIDCGANYADLWLSLREKIKPECYFTFEPGGDEYKSVCENAPISNNFKLALSCDNSVKSFFVNEADADSSLVEPSSYSRIVDIETITLSSFVERESIKAIKLFKLEAEGFEPEILAGSLSVINMIEYIAIDGGNERGVQKEETFSSLANLLFANNFEIVSVNFDWGRALFKNRRKQY